MLRSSQYKHPDTRPPVHSTTFSRAMHRTYGLLPTIEAAFHRMQQAADNRGNFGIADHDRAAIRVLLLRGLIIETNKPKRSEPNSPSYLRTFQIVT